MDNKKEDMLCLGINFIIYERVAKKIELATCTVICSLLLI